MTRKLFIAAFCITGALAQDAAMLQADAAFMQAIAKSDKSAVEKFLDTLVTWTTAAGKVLTKSDVLRDLPQPAIANVKDAETKAYTYGDLGNVQVNSGRAHVLRVWVKRPASKPNDAWKVIVYQELMSRETPPTFTPGAGKECENPCKSIPFTPANDTERQVVMAYTKLETAAHARNSPAFGPMVAEEFVAASSNSDKLQTKHSRMDEFDRAKDGGVAPTPLVSARMSPFGDAMLMVSEHKPDRGAPLFVTRIWVKRGGNWVETLSYQTSVVK